VSCGMKRAVLSGTIVQREYRPGACIKDERMHQDHAKKLCRR
jgi:hypothetical protein